MLADEQDQCCLAEVDKTHHAVSLMIWMITLKVKVFDLGALTAVFWKVCIDAMILVPLK